MMFVVTGKCGSWCGVEVGMAKVKVVTGCAKIYGRPGGP
jgi:hypothetical protein